ncbi:MAG: NAD(P)H-binding protein [Chitinophagaceae bacterium]
MNERTASLIGATGLIGNYLLQELLKDDYFTTVRLLIRRPVALSHPKLEKKLVDFNDAESFKLALEGTTIIFCCIGTTTKKVKGNKELYRKIDFDIPVNTAKFGKETGCETFVFVSSLGANKNSNSFYLKLKGETEEALKSIGLNSLYIMRPSLLLGKRKEFRLGEKLAEVFMVPVSFLLPAKYKPVDGMKVAKAMIVAAKQEKKGIFVYENREIKNFNK